MLIATFFQNFSHQSCIGIARSEFWKGPKHAFLGFLILNFG